ncbi:hypothetical protein QIA_3761, partial [Clostridioides difficile 6057]
QQRLLRVLQEKEVMRMGGSKIKYTSSSREVPRFKS